MHPNDLGYVLHTLGCKANSYDGALIEAELQRRGWHPASDENASLCVVNSCTVTDEADRQSRKLASRLKRLNPRARVVVTGCGAEVDPERMAASAGIDYVIGNRDKPRIVDLMLEALKRPVAEGGVVLGVAEGYPELVSRHPMDRLWPVAEESLTTPATEITGRGARTRAFMKIQDGCNAFCTYCVIPYGRGPARSLDIAAVVSQAQALVAQGVREIVLTGVNLGDFGADWSDRPQLVPLLENLFAQTAIERVRLSSLDPTEITSDLLSLMEREPRLAPHLHVSLQSPHARILKLMKRKYTASDVETCLRAIAALRPAAGERVFVGMDVITGFPGESDADFEWTRLALSALPWSRLHVFPFSEREGTPATRLPSAVPPAERARRAKILRELSLERLRSMYQAEWRAIGRLERVLLESPVRGPTPDRWLSGYSSGYRRVLVRDDGSGNVGENALVDVQVEGILDLPSAGDVAFIGRVQQSSNLL